MARTSPGLTPFVEDRPEVRRVSAGMRIPDARIDTPRLRPGGANVSDTYTGAPQMPTLAQGVPQQIPTGEGEMMNRLVQSLGALNPNLQRFITTITEPNNKNIDSKVQKLLAGKTYAEQQKILNENPLFKNQVAKEYGGKLVGLKKADETIERLKKEYLEGGFDREGGNLEEWINNAIKADITGLDETSATQYADRVRAGTNSLYTTHGKWLAEGKLRQQDDIIYGAFKATVNKGFDDNKDGVAILAEVEGQFKANKALTNKPFIEQEAMLLQAVQQFAGDIKPEDPDAPRKYALVEQMLNAKRKLPDGSEMSFLERGSTSGQAAKILEHARKVNVAAGDWIKKDNIANLREGAASGQAGFIPKLDAFVKENPGVISSSQYQAMRSAHLEATARNLKALEEQKRIQAEEAQKKDILLSAQVAAASGTLYKQEDQTYIDRNGNVKVYKAEDIRKDTVAAAHQLINVQYEAARKKIGEEAALNMKVAKETELYGTSLEKNPLWENMFKNGPGAANTVVGAGGDIPGTLVDSFRNYRHLKTKSPQLLNRHVDRENAMFWEVADAALATGFAANEKEALTLAQNATQKARSTINAGLPGPEKFNDRISKKMTGSWWERVTKGTQVSETLNNGVAVLEARELATTLAAGLGINWELAADRAAETVMKRYVVVNNSAVRIADKEVDKDFANHANRYVRYWLENNAAALKKEGVNPSDISIRSVNDRSNVWVIYNTSTFEQYDLPGSNFTPKQIREMLEIVQKKQEIKGNRVVEAEKEKARKVRERDALDRDALNSNR